MAETIESVQELQEKVNSLVEFIVEEACENSVDGTYSLEWEDGLDEYLTWDDYNLYNRLIMDALFQRDEVDDILSGDVLPLCVELNEEFMRNEY